MILEDINLWGKKQKKVIRDAKFKAYDDLYDKLGTKDG